MSTDELTGLAALTFNWTRTLNVDEVLSRAARK
jgi:hypothetical protein